MAAFLKIGDIKGEFASNVSFTYREDGANRFTTGGGGDSLTDAGLGNNSFHQGADVWTNGSATSVKNALHSDYKPQEAVNDVGWWTVDGADFRDHNHGKRSNWDVICDVGTSIKQPTDLRANGAVHQDMPMDTHPNDNLLGYPGAGSDALTNYRPEGVSEGVSSPAGYTDFVPAIALRSDNRFVIEPVNLFQGLDAGNAPDSPLINPDSLSNPHNCLPYTVDGEGNNP